MKRARRTVASAMVLVTVLLMTMPGLPVAAAATQPVFALGDSVLLGAEREVPAALPAWQVTFDAKVSRFLTHGLQVLRERRDEVHRDVVIHLGNNYYGDRVQFAREIDEAMRILDGVPQVVWVNVREFQASRQEVNAALAAAAERWPTLEIADWNTLGAQPGMTGRDGLHLTRQGAQAMAQLIRRHLEDGPRRPVRHYPTVHARGDASDAGPRGDVALAAPGVDVVPARDGGYWLASADGEVLARGGASFHGSAGGVALRRPVVAISPTPSGHGYRLAAADGGVFTFGDARFFGSTGSIQLNQPIVAAMTTRSGSGYWLVAADGGVFTFGDAVFHGSTADLALREPIVSATPTATGRGYWLLAADGGVFTFGDALYLGALADDASDVPAVDIARSPTGLGYSILTATGQVRTFGDAAHHGDAPVGDGFFGLAATALGRGYWLVSQTAA